MKKILYLHGFASSGNSHSASVIKKYCDSKGYEFYAPDLPLHNPKETLAMLQQLYHTNDYDIVIGTSLGGFFALSCCPCSNLIVVNPALNPGSTLRNKNVTTSGVHSYLNPRSNGDITFEIKNNYFDELDDVSNITKFSRDYTLINADISKYIFIGEQDTIIDKSLVYSIHDNEFARKSCNITNFDGGHRITNELLTDYILPLIDELPEIDWSKYTL